MESTAPPSSKDEASSITPPEAWGGERLSDKYTYLRQSVNGPARFGMSVSGVQAAGSLFSGLQDPSSSAGVTSLTNSSINYANLRAKDVSTSQETSLSIPDHLASGSLSISTKSILGQGNLDSSQMSSLTQRFSTYAERISTTSTFSDGLAFSVGSPKMKKSGAETREELLNSLLLKSDTSAPTELSHVLPANVCKFCALNISDVYIAYINNFSVLSSWILPLLCFIIKPRSSCVPVI